MSKPENRPGRSEGQDINVSRIEGHSSVPNDLPDSDRDAEELKSETTYIDLPDVKDIPGQEFINTAPLGELGDTTISSDDEEGKGIFDEDNNEDEDVVNLGDNLNRSEKRILNDTSYMPTRDEDNLRKAAMDNTDFQGEPLNERSFGEERSGSDLDDSNRE